MNTGFEPAAQQRPPIPYVGQHRNMGKRVPAWKARAFVELAAAVFGTTPADVMSPSRRKAVVAARWRAIRMLKAHNPDYSLPAIGAVMGVDHTTVLHCLQQGERLPYPNGRIER